MEDLPLEEVGDWSYSRRPRHDDPAQGWKLHLSATVLSAETVYARALPVLRRHDAFYKIPSRPELIAWLNSGLTHFSQVGKFLTIYPRTTREAVTLARELHLATRGLAGPRIPYDARYRFNSLVHYRYGAFFITTKNGVGFIQRPDGRRIADERAPRRAVPAWLQDPFGRRPRRTNKGPIGRELLAFKARVQRGKGGVYETLDLSVKPSRRVILKEGRRHGETDLDGEDGFSRIVREGRILRALRRARVPIPQVLREFNQNGNRYLVLERIKGRPLVARDGEQPGRFSVNRAVEIFEKLAPILARIHSAGWVWRDCKPSHIFIEGGTMRLLDFEGACRIEDTRALPWNSPNYVPPGWERRTGRPGGTREDDYALGVITFQFGTGEFPPFDHCRRQRIYQRTGFPDSMRERIEALLHLSRRFVAR